VDYTGTKKGVTKLLKMIKTPTLNHNKTKTKIENKNKKKT